MNKEPISLYLFRFFCGFGLLVFMGMLYWSLTLMEDNLRGIRSELALIKNELRNNRGSYRADNNLSQGNMGGIKAKPLSVENNLLKEDPFYTTTLPKLLGDHFVPHGILHDANFGKPDNLHPFSNWSHVMQWQSFCGISVAQNQFGKYETLAPNMAVAMEERVNPKSGVPEFWVFLRDNVYWAPLQPEFFPSISDLAQHFLEPHQVTADDFKFYFDAIMNPYVQEPGAVALRTLYNGLQEIEVIDSLTFVVRWKAEEVTDSDGAKTKKIKYIARQLTASLRPLACFVYKFFANGKSIIDDAGVDAYRTNSVWAQNFAEHWAKNIIVSCGPWLFNGMTERAIRFKRNPDYFEPLAALAEEMEVQFKDSPDNIWQEFKAGKLDSYEVRPEQRMEMKSFLVSDAYQQQVRKGDAIEQLEYFMQSYSYVGWNETKPFFKSARVRRAMTMAIDRQRIIDQILNGQGIQINGTFFRYSPAYDASIPFLPFDPSKARKILEEEGWYDRSGNGVIEKEIDGKLIPFSFSLTYFVKNPTTKAVCEYVATALRDIGVECRLNGVDIADLSASLEDKSFDALALAWVLGAPPEDPRQIWSSAGAREKGSSNAIGFANAEIDKIIDQLDYEYNQEKRIALYHSFDTIIYEEQPYTFLYTPKQTMLYREYLQNVFLPIDRQDLIPGANMAEPQPTIFWIKTSKGNEK